jgi:outer membrane protein W
MFEMKTTIAAGTIVLAAAFASPATAGSYDGNFLVRAGITVVNPDASADVFVGWRPSAWHGC